MLRTITRQVLGSGHKVAAQSQRIAVSPFVGSQRAYSVGVTDPNDPDDNASFHEMVSLFYEKGMVLKSRRNFRLMIALVFLVTIVIISP